MIPSEVSVQEADGRTVDAYPRIVTEEPVNLVWDDHFLERRPLCLQPPSEIDGLLELHVAVVVTLNKENR